MKIAIDLQAAQTPSSRHRGIGRASLSLVQSMARFSRGHDIHIVLNEAFADVQLGLRMALPQVPTGNYHWFRTPTNAEFDAPAMVQVGERFRERFVSRIQPDLLHITSLMEGLNDGARGSFGTVPGLPAPLGSVTLYDLIPFLRQDPYLVNDDVRGWYYRKLASLKRAGLALAISDYARQEAIDALGLDPERVASISCGADPLFRPVDWKAGEREELAARYDLNRPFVMYTGGDDERKNLKGLIAGWAAVPAALRTQHQLLIVCRLTDARRIELRQFATEQGMSNGELVLPGTFVPDEDLRRLYAACALFVFPSLHEGFGLPVLEAMLCGAPVIAADTSSLPEVLGRPDALFDPKRTESIRDAIAGALSDPAKLASLRAHAPMQASKFSWDISADLALDAFERAHARERFEATTRIAVPSFDDRRLAVVLGDSIPPAPALVPLIEALSVRHQVELLSPAPLAGELAARFACRSTEWAAAHPGRHVRTLHVQGADEALGTVIERVRRQPGPVVLHGLAQPSLPSADFDTLFSLHGWRAVQAVKEVGLQAAAAKLSAVPALLDVAPAVFAADPAINQQWVSAFGDTAATAIPVLSLTGLQPVLDALERIPAGIAPAPAGRRNRNFYVDVTMVAREDLRTGIQRVVRSVLAALPTQLPAGWTLVPVLANGEHGYLYADAMLADWLDMPLPDSIRARNWTPITPVAGDYLLGLDWTPQPTLDVLPHLATWRARGVRIGFVIYDLLPLLTPQFFPPEVSRLFADWMGAIARNADSLVAISHSVADEARAWFAAHPEATGATVPRIGSFHLGADLAASLPTAAVDEDARRALQSLAPGRTVLTVATVEPRKGHAEALDAFEQLWREDAAVNWVVVGKPGWDNEAIVSRLRGHAQAGKRLLWLPAASDAVLADAYARADLLLVPSHGEGFGLPLIEGAQAGLPLLVRDLPVFHEVAGANAAYFTSDAKAVAGSDVPTLHTALASWLAGEPVPASGGLARQSWAASTRELLSVVLGQRLPD